MKTDWSSMIPDMIPMDSVRKQITKATVASVFRKQEMEFKEVLDAHLPAGWTLESLKGRLTLISLQGNPVKTLCLDDKPILEIYPLEFGPVENRGESWVTTVTQRFRRL